MKIKAKTKRKQFFTRSSYSSPFLMFIYQPNTLFRFPNVYFLFNFYFQSTKTKARKMKQFIKDCMRSSHSFFVPKMRWIKRQKLSKSFFGKLNCWSCSKEMDKSERLSFCRHILSHSFPFCLIIYTSRIPKLNKNENGNNSKDFQWCYLSSVSLSWSQIRIFPHLENRNTFYIISAIQFQSVYSLVALTTF